MHDTAVSSNISSLQPYSRANYLSISTCYQQLRFFLCLNSRWSCNNCSCPRRNCKPSQQSSNYNGNFYRNHLGTRNVKRRYCNIRLLSFVRSRLRKLKLCRSLIRRCISCIHSDRTYPRSNLYFRSASKKLSWL